MASIYDLKPTFQALLRPACRALVRLGVTPNQVTAAAIVLSAVGGALVLARPTARWPLLLVPVVLFVRMALNALDGMMAREHDLQSPLGAFLNELGDVVADAALYLPFAALANVSAPVVVVVVVLATVSELAGVVAAQLGASRRYDGPMGKSDRAFVFGALGLALGLGWSGSGWRGPDVVLALVLVLLVVTISRRVRGGLKELAA